LQFEGLREWHAAVGMARSDEKWCFGGAMDKQLQAAKSVKMEQKNTGSFIWKFHYFPLSLF